MRRFKKFIRSERGAVFIIIGLCFGSMVGIVATAVDFARASLLRSEMISALDSAALAGGTMANADSASLTAMINKYYAVDLPPTYMGATIGTVGQTLSTDKTTLTLTGNAQLNNSMMQVVGWNKANMSATSQVTLAHQGMELVLVMDNTGSMLDPAGGSQSKIQAAKTAANLLLGILYGTNETQENFWVGIVPFSQAVNIGTSHPSFLDSAYDTTLNFGPVATTSCPAITGYTATYGNGPTCTYKSTTTTAAPNFNQLNWTGCVESRSNGSASPQYDITDDTPTTKPFRMYYWPDDSNNNWLTPPSSSQSCTGSGSHRTCTTTTTTIFNYSYDSGWGANLGPNIFCPQPLTQMVAEKTTLTNAINSMSAGGNTHIDLGLAWAWRLLSPKWRYKADGVTSWWGGEMATNKLPLDYNTPLMSKVVVLMTDGDNTISSGLYSAYGYPTSNQLGTNECVSGNCANGISQLNTRTTAICTNMKAQGILIYTIALGTDISTAGKSLLSACATNSSYYFESPSTSDLQAIFTTIGDSLSNLRISQ